MSASIHYRSLIITVSVGGSGPKSFPAKLMFGYRDEDDVWVSRLETPSRVGAPPFELPHHLWVDQIVSDDDLMQSLGDQARDERRAR